MECRADRLAAFALCGFFLVAFMCESLAPSRPLCLWLLLFGHECPGCGLSRAMVALLTGQVRAAMHQHLLALPIAVLSAYVCLRHVILRHYRTSKQELVVQ